MLLSSLRQRQAPCRRFAFIQHLDPTVGVTINTVIFPIVRIDALSFVSHTTRQTSA